MGLKDTSVAITVILVLASAGHSDAETPQDRDTPVFRVQVWGDISADFSRRVWSYFELRREVEKGLPPLPYTGDPAEIRRAVDALAERIRVARADAMQGDIFTSSISSEFRNVLRPEINANTLAVIMDDSPGEFRARINRTYPEGQPFSTVPGNILAALPSLPDDIQYRFVGRHLILFDARARIIIDRLPHAIHRRGVVAVEARTSERGSPHDRQINSRSVSAAPHQ